MQRQQEQPAQSRVSQTSSKAKIFGTTQQFNSVPKASYAPNRFVGTIRVEDRGNIFEYPQPEQASKQQRPQLDESWVADQKVSQRVHELLKHSRNSANMESLLTLFRLQKPLTLELPSMRATSNNAQNFRSTVNSQIPAYYTTYHTQLDTEAERVRERVKEEARVVEFIIEKYQRVHDTHDRLQREAEQITLKVLEYHVQHKMKVFNKQAKYTFQLMESQTDEIKDFYEEIYNLTELFSIATHESNKAQNQLNPILAARSSAQPNEFLKSSAVQTNNLQKSKTEDALQQRGIDLHAFAVRLYSDLQHYAKHIETILSEQRRVQNVSQTNEQFNKLSQQLVQELQNFPTQENKTIKELDQLYSMCSTYFAIVAREARDLLSQQNAHLGDLRDAISSIDRLGYVHQKVVELTPQINQYMQKLCIQLQLTGLQKLDVKTLPNPETINEHVMTKMSALHKQFKQDHISAQNHQHFKNIRLKVFKHYGDIIQHQKHIVRSQHELQVETYQFTIQTVQAEQEADVLVVQAKKNYDSLSHKLSKQGIVQIVDHFHKINALSNDLQLRKTKLVELKVKSDDQYYQKILQILGDSIEPLQQKLSQAEKLVNQYVSLGDPDALIEYQDLSEQLAQDQPKLQQHMDQFLVRLSEKITNSYDTDTLNDYKLELQKRKLQSNKKIEAYQKLLDKELNETVKSQIRIVLSKWDQYDKMTSKLDTMMSALEYLSIQNIQNTTLDIQEKDPHNSIHQLEELCQENFKKMSDIVKEDIVWTEYRAHDFEALIQQEYPGFVWSRNLLSEMLSFQKGYQQLFREVEAQPSRRQSQQEFRPASGGYFADQGQQIPQEPHIDVFVKRISTVQIEDLQQFLINQPFSRILSVLQQEHPSTIRWNKYQQLFNSVVFQIMETYFLNMKMKVGTMGVGIVLANVNLDAHLNEKILNYFRRLNISQLGEHSIDVLFGNPISKPRIFGELLEFLFIVNQIFKQLKPITDPSVSPPSMLQQQDDSFEINKIVSQYLDVLKDSLKNATQVSELNIRLPKINQGSEVSQTNSQIDPPEDAELIAPIVALLINHLDQGDNNVITKFIMYVNFQSAWIGDLMRQFTLPISITNPILFNLVNTTYSLLNSQTFDAQTVKNVLTVDQISNRDIEYMRKCQKQVEDAILIDKSIDNLKHLTVFLKEVTNFYAMNQYAQQLIDALRYMEDTYIKPLEDKKERIHPKLSYLPQAFVDMLHSRLRFMLNICDTIQNYIENAQLISVGIININTQDLLNQMQVLRRWGLIVAEVQNRIFPPHDQDQPQSNLLQLFSDIDDQNFRSTQIQVDFQASCDSITQ